MTKYSQETLSTKCPLTSSNFCVLPFDGEWAQKHHSNFLPENLKLKSIKDLRGYGMSYKINSICSHLLTQPLDLRPQLESTKGNNRIRKNQYTTWSVTLLRTRFYSSKNLMSYHFMIIVMSIWCKFFCSDGLVTQSVDISDPFPRCKRQ